MNKDKLAEFLSIQEDGWNLDNLIAETNGEIQRLMLPAWAKEIHAEGISNLVYNLLVGLVAAADDILRKGPAPALQTGPDTYECPKCGYSMDTKELYEELSEPMRKFIKSEPLTTQQHVIAGAVRELGNRNAKLQAIKLIRGTFLDDDGGYCPMAEAMRIYNAIIARSY